MDSSHRRGRSCERGSEEDGPPLERPKSRQRPNSQGRPKRKRNNINGRKVQSGLRNGLSIGLIAFAVAVVLGGPLGGLLQDISLVGGVLVLAGSIGIAIAADILAIAATAGEEDPFNAMASKKVPGAREALTIVRNAGRVNSFFSDVIGDICGTITGMVATPIILSLHALYPDVPVSVITMLVLGLIAFLTIGGKAAEKDYAVKASTTVILAVGKTLYYLKSLRRWPRKANG